MIPNSLSPIRRRLVGATIALGLVASGLLVAPMSAQAAASVAVSDAVAQILADTNALRAAGGLAPLTEVSAMDTVAQNWSAQMYANGSMTHNPNYSTQIPSGWTGAAENIAVGYTATTVVEAWHQSSGHYANIMGNYNAIGIGYYELNGQRYFTQDFGKYAQLPAPTTSGATSFVLAAYTDILGRTPAVSDQGVQWWVANITAGVPRTSIASGFTGSDEYRNKMIVSAYQTVLNRNPEPSGQAWWLSQMQAGNAQPDDAHRIFLTTDEFYNVEGAGTVTGYITALYEDILGRDPDASGLSFWSKALAQSGRNSIVNGMWNSDETIGERVTQAYSDLLGRSANSSEIAFWKAVALRSGTTTMRTQILASAEYWSRAATRF